MHTNKIYVITVVTAILFLATTAVATTQVKAIGEMATLPPDTNFGAMTVCPGGMRIYNPIQCYNIGHDQATWQGNQGKSCDASIHVPEFCQGWVDSQNGVNNPPSSSQYVAPGAGEPN